MRIRRKVSLQAHPFIYELRQLQPNISDQLRARASKEGRKNLPEGTMMTTSKMMTQITRHTRIFMSFHHICLRTRLAPRRKPCADTARLSVLSWRESRRSPRSETPIMFDRIARIVSSISYRKHIPLVSCLKRCQATQRPSLFISFFLSFFSHHFPTRTAKLTLETCCVFGSPPWVAVAWVPAAPFEPEGM